MTTTTRKRRTYTVTGQLGRKLRRAEQLTNEIAKLKEELDPIRDYILQYLISRDLSVAEAGDFQAIRKQRHKWEYTQATEFEMAKVRNLQKWEQQQGTAVDTPTTYLQLSSK